MSKTEEQAKEYWIKNGKTEILCSKKSAELFIKMLADFANSQPLNLDVKVDDEFNVLEEPKYYSQWKVGNSIPRKEAVLCEAYDKARTIRERLESELLFCDYAISGEYERWTKIQQLTKERDELKAKYDDLQKPFSHREYIPSLEQQLQAEKKKVEELENMNKELKKSIKIFNRETLNNE